MLFKCNVRTRDRNIFLQLNDCVVYFKLSMGVTLDSG